MQVCISGFVPVRYYHVTAILWFFLAGQIALEAASIPVNGSPLRQVGPNWVLYFASSIIASFFRYVGEVYLRKAFIK